MTSTAAGSSERLVRHQHKWVACERLAWWDQAQGEGEGEDEGQVGVRLGLGSESHANDLPAASNAADT